MGLPQGVCVAGYPWNAYPPRDQRGTRPIWRATHWAAPFFASGRVVPESQGRSAELRTKPYGHWRLDHALPKTKNACCDTCSDLLDSL